MRRNIFMQGIILVLIILLAWSLSCKPEKKETTRVQPTVIKIDEKEIQAKNKAIYKTREIEGEKRGYLSLDFSLIDRPAGPADFQQVFHQPPIRQYRTGTCWSFATTSFLESELKRLGRGEFKLSEMYTVYWEYV